MGKRDEGFSGMGVPLCSEGSHAHKTTCHMTLFM
jgi:hypothetical protein